MKSRCVNAVTVLAVLFLFSFLSFAQEENKNAKETPKFKTAASLAGTSGLFQTWDAESLRHGEYNFTVGYQMFHRDPGELTIGTLPVGIATGIIDRLEVFESMDVQRHIRAHDINTSQIGNPLLARTKAGINPYFSRIAPFINVTESTGRSDSHMGVKFNILSERRGDPISVGVAGFATFPGQRSAAGLSRGLSSSNYQAGFVWLFSKTAANFARFHVNIGNAYNTEADSGVATADFGNEFIYRAGMEMFVQKPIRLIAEVNGASYYGKITPGLNTKGPLDLVLGLRAFPREWVSLGAGYQLTLNHIKDSDIANPSGYHGFVVQGAFAIRRNDPPTVECSVDKISIKQGDKAKVTAAAKDPDGDKLSYTWETSGGKISGTDSTATFDATGLKPGKYTVKATVKDKTHAAVSCTSDITVTKLNHPPTASIEPRTFNIEQGESVDFRCTGNDPDNDPLTYSWAVQGQRIPSTGNRITFGSEGRNPGNYTVACTVSDGEAAPVTASASGNVREKPPEPPRKKDPEVVKPPEEKVNHAPTISCQTTTVELWSGGTKELRVTASDQDNDRLTYTWSGTGVSGSGNTGKFNAAGLKAGSYTVNVTVSDGKLSASCPMTVNVSELLIVTKDGKCGYFKPGLSRVDNCAKAILDDLSVRLKNESKLRINIIGYTDSTEKVKKLGEQRAKAMEAYLEKKGVEKSRMTVTDGGANKPAGDNKTLDGRKLNRRVEIEITVK